MLRLLDFETTSPLDLENCGVDSYVKEATVLAVGWRTLDGYRSWVPQPGDVVPADLLDASAVTMAHNSRFDRLVWHTVLRRDFPSVPSLPVERWLDTAMVARAQGLPGKLDLLLRTFKLSPKKSTPGVKKLFVTPVEELPPFSDPVWDELLRYLAWDVDGLDQVVDLMDPVSQETWEEFWVCERINDRGLPVDVDKARRALELLAPVTKRFVSEVVDQTGFKPTQYVKMAQWVYGRLPSHVQPLMLNAKTGKPSLDSRSLLPAILRHDDTPEHIKDVLRSLQQCRKSSSYKFSAVVNREVGGRLCGEYVFNGAANTGRFSSHGLQMHNNPKKVIESAAFEELFSPTFDFDTRWREIPGLLKGSLRPLVWAMGDGTIIWVDWSQIEARALPYLTEDPEVEPRMDVFRRNEDIYMKTVRDIWGCDDPAYRQAAKTAELALGFCGMEGAMETFCHNFGLHLTREERRSIVVRWHAANAWATRFGDNLLGGYVDALAGESSKVGKISFYPVRTPIGVAVVMLLPDGRPLYYQGATPFDCLRQDKGKWLRSSVWRGILSENATQATCASLLRSKLVNLEGHLPDGAELIGHTHDEILAEVPSRDETVIRRVAEFIGREMATAPPWLEGCPLNVEWMAGPRYGHALYSGKM